MGKILGTDKGQVYGIVPEKVDACFFAKHLSPYLFVKEAAVNKAVLEIGFGEGYGSNHLSDIAKKVVGIDIAYGNILRANQRYKKPNLQFLCMDAVYLAFKNETFDIVCSFQVIEHIRQESLLEYLSQIYRVLKDNGSFYVCTLNLEHNKKPGQPYEKQPLHDKEFTSAELKSLLGMVFPRVELYGLHPTLKHLFFQRLKKAGIFVKRYYNNITAKDFKITARPNIRKSIDIIGICRK